MNQLLFVAWAIAGAVLILPLGKFLRLGRSLAVRCRPRRRRDAAVATLAAEETALRSLASPTRRLSTILSLLLYVAFIAGAIYYIPRILSWTLDTPHPMAAVSSQSMWPTLKKGDLIFLQGVDKPEDLEIGDIIAFQHPKGITVHRVVKVEGDLITTKGDANPLNDKPIRFEWVEGRVLTIGGRLIKVPLVGSIAGLFGPLATQAGQSPEQEQSSANESGEPSATLEPSASSAGQTQDLQTGNASPGSNELVSVDGAGNQANGTSTSAAISEDGRLVAFVSAASNLIPGDTNGQGDVFIHDRHTGATERVSVDSAGNEADGSSEAPAVSADGRFVAFVSVASNLVVRDTNGQGDIFVHDRQTGATERVSVNGAGSQANGGSEAPARYIVCEGKATDVPALPTTSVILNSSCSWISRKCAQSRAKTYANTSTSSENAPRRRNRTRTESRSIARSSSSSRRVPSITARSWSGVVS